MKTNTIDHNLTNEFETIIILKGRNRKEKRNKEIFTRLKTHHHIYIIANMPLIDIPVLQYAGRLSHGPSLMALAPKSLQ